MGRFVFDTNALIDEPHLLNHYNLEEELIIPTVVLNELDGLKKSKGITGYNARKTIEYLLNTEKTIQILGTNSKRSRNDDIILEIAKEQSAVLVTKDQLLKIKAKGQHVIVDMPREGEKTDEKIFTGYKELETQASYIDTLYKQGFMYLDDLGLQDDELYPNQYIILKSFNGNKQSVITKVKDDKLVKIFTDYKSSNVWGLEPRNVEQNLAMDALLDPDVQVVSLVGIAGSGKTLLSLGAGLSQIFGRGSHEKQYRKIIVARPIQTLGKDIGFLPGEIAEKLDPWLGPIYDNLSVLSGHDKAKVDRWFEKGKIEAEAIVYIRGRSIANSYVIIDEAQNLSPHEMKTILTRVGNNTKIILTGDVEQIDSKHLCEYSNGLTYMIERFKKHDVAAHVTLTKGERSRVATIAAKEL